MDSNVNKIHPNISIIVPVYNCENYINKCLDSIFNQQFSGTFEVIAVDDGSSDQSVDILKKYQNKESRLRIIEHGINKKLSFTRATGIKASKGEYIMHVDQDDWLLPNALKELHAKCIETDVDVLVFNYIKEDNTGNKKFINRIHRQLITSDKLKVQNLFFGATWSKIVKRHMAMDLLSGEVGINHTEDFIYGIEILSKANKIGLITEYYYTYFVNPNSMTHATKIEEYLETQFITLDQVQKIIDKYEVSSTLTSNILDYFDKWIYLEFAKMHHFGHKNLTIPKGLIKEFSNFPIINESRIKSLELSLSNKFYCYMQIFKRFSSRMFMGISRKYFISK